MKIFLFDFDGVIIDTLPIAIGVYNSLLNKYNIPKQFTSKDFTDLFFNNFHDSLKIAIPNNEIREKIIVERTNEYIRRKNEFKVFKGIKKTLSLLAKNGKIIIISSNRTNFIKAILENKDINCIDNVLGEDVGKSKIKKINLQKKKYPNSEIYYIGDTIGDIKEGKQAGIITVGTTWGFHSRKMLEVEKPDYLFDKPSELTSLVQ